MENEEKRMISSYEVTQSIHIGKKEVVFGGNAVTVNGDALAAVPHIPLRAV